MMNSSKHPPRWLELLLLALMPSRDREPISGDLLEDYYEEHLPKLGSVRARLWYFRQLLAIIFITQIGGSLMKRLLVCLSVFASLAGAWLAIMENVLRHAGYGMRTLTALFILIQAVATLWFVAKGNRRWSLPLTIGGAALLVIGVAAVWNTLNGPHFEGFALVIGTLLILQGSLTSALAWQTRAITPG